jgi:chemotaxis protein MotB
MGGGGGAWKVAAADFFTAMMALFMVLWILGSEQELLEQMQEYFRNPPSPWDRLANKYLVETGEFEGLSDLEDADKNFFNSDHASVLKGIRDAFMQLIEKQTTDRQPPIDLSLVGDELRLILYNREDMSLFRGDTTALTEWGEFMVMNIAWLLTQHELQVTIESHVSSDYRIKKASYGPFELTTDRSNRVRRSLEHFGKEGVDVKRVVGYGSVRPLRDGETELRKNDRTIISLSMPQQMTTEDFKQMRDIEERLQENQQSIDLLNGL